MTATDGTIEERGARRSLASALILTLIIFGTGVGILQAVLWQSVWGNFDLWIPPILMATQIACLAAAIATFAWPRVRRRTRSLVLLGVMAVGAATQIGLLGTAYGHLPDNF